MKTIFETKLQAYSNKAYVAEKAGVFQSAIDYAIDRGGKLKPKLKEKYWKAMVDARIIKEEEYTPETLFSYQ